eukprot:scaffold10099_cov137-Isochrysis_galbana.AAC.5
MGSQKPFLASQRWLIYSASCHIYRRHALSTLSRFRKTPRARGGAQWRLATAPAGAHRGGLDRGQRCQARPRGQHRRELNTGTKIPPARQPDARPGFAQSTAGPLLTTCQSSGSRHGM